MEEIFKKIPFIEGYEISNFGRVKSLPKQVKGLSRKKEEFTWITKEKFLTTYTNRGGCVFFCIKVDGKKVNKSIKKLVNELFNK